MADSGCTNRPASGTAIDMLVDCRVESADKAAADSRTADVAVDMTVLGCMIVVIAVGIVTGDTDEAADGVLGNHAMGLDHRMDDLHVCYRFYRPLSLDLFLALSLDLVDCHEIPLDHHLCLVPLHFLPAPTRAPANHHTIPVVFPHSCSTQPRIRIHFPHPLHRTYCLSLIRHMSRLDPDNRNEVDSVDHATVLLVFQTLSCQLPRPWILIEYSCASFSPVLLPHRHSTPSRLLQSPRRAYLMRRNP
jgi:hypothetical protein